MYLVGLILTFLTYYPNSQSLKLVYDPKIKSSNCSVQDHPYMLQFVTWYDKNGTATTFHCSATLLSEHVALTAANCLKRQPKKVMQSKYFVHGKNPHIEIESNTPVIMPQKCYIHPKYSENSSQNDIAVCVLHNPPPNNAKFVKLPKELKGETCPGKNESTLAMMGWSLLGNGSYPESLRCANGFQFRNCTPSYSKYALCLTQLNQTLTETADLGAPLFCGDIQIGIASGGIPNTTLMAYTRVDRYLDFILKILSDPFEDGKRKRSISDEPTEFEPTPTSEERSATISSRKSRNNNTLYIVGSILWSLRRLVFS